MSLCDGAPPPTDELLLALPARVGALCRDPNGVPRTASGNAQGSLEGECRAWLAERCGALIEHGVMRISEQQYVDASGAPDSLRATVFHFRRPEAAHAYYSARLFENQHPSRLDVKEVAGTPFGFVRGDKASVLYGAKLFEFAFTSSRWTQAQIRESAAPLFDALAREVGAAVPSVVPENVRLLPEAERIRFGVRSLEANAFGVDGAGPGAFGYYQRGDRRYQLYVNDAGDEGAASDIERTLRRSPGARKLEKMAFAAFELHVGPELGSGHWLLARLGDRLAGAGEDLVDLDGEPQDVREAHRLSRLEKFRLVRDLLTARPAPVPSATAR